MREILVVAAAVGLAGTVQAQEVAPPADGAGASQQSTAGGSSAALEEIVVTATKRAESLQDVSLSISAIQGQAIQDRGLETLDQVTSYMPNVRIAGIDGPAKFINIRGLGSGNNRGFETSVGLFLDGVYLGREVFLFDSYNDIARIEAIKGPQGALFGKNTIAGAISVITRDPTREFSGDVGVTVGENDKRELTAAISGPLGDTVSARIAVQYLDRGGYVKNTFTGTEDGDRKVAAGRIKLRWEPTDSFDADLTAQYADLKQKGTGRQLGTSVPCVSFAPAAACAPLSTSHPATAGGTRSLLDIARTIDPLAENGKNFQRSVDGRDGESRENLFTKLQANQKLGDHTLTYIGSYAEIFNGQIVLDPDASPFNGGLLTNNEDYNQQSHELRIVSPKSGLVDYIGGVYYFRSKVDAQQIFRTSLGPTTGTANQTTKSFSVFGQGTLHASDSLRAIAGLRWINERKHADLAQVGAVPFPTYSRPDVKYKDKKVLFNGSVEYDLQPDIMAYASYAQGYKAGGFNFFDLRNTTPIYKAETSDGYEIGLKSELFDRRVRLNLAAFLTDFSDLQVSAYDGTALVVSNAASARSKGIEAELNIQVSERLLLNLSGAYLHARFKKFDRAGCTIAQQLNTVGFCTQDLSGRQLERAPDWTGVANAVYTLPLSDSLNLSLSGDAIYSSSLYTVGDLDRAGYQKAYTLYNARVAIEDADRRWSIAAVGKNLTNKAYLYSGGDVFQFAGSHSALFGEARQIDVQFSYRW